MTTTWYAGDEPQPEPINVVLTFKDSDGRRWLAGALLGPLQAEDRDTDVLRVVDLIDRAVALVDFRVVKPQPRAEIPGVPDCPNAQQHGNPFRYCACGWIEGQA